MSFDPITLAATIVGGLALAGLLGWIRRPRLVVLVPRSFSYSRISDRGQLVEISLLNRGFKTEESIEVTLNHTMRYELLGADSQDARVEGNKVQVPRIGPSDRVTVLLLVENGVFRKDDIVQCLSKETKGTVVAKLEEVPPSGPQRVTIVGLFIAVPALLYAASLGIDYAFKSVREDSASAVAAAAAKIEEAKTPIEIGGWVVPSYYKATSGLYQDLASSKLQVKIGATSRKGDLVTVPVMITNDTSRVLNATLRMNSAGSAKRFKSFELSTSDILIVPGRSEMRSIRVVAPELPADRIDRTIYVEVFIRDTEGDSLALRAQFEAT